MTDLIPCPFCGSGWLYETMRDGYCNETPAMFCNSCKAVVTWEQVEDEGVNDETRKFVREHWNTRAFKAVYEDGNLCRMVTDTDSYVPERTCKMVSSRGSDCPPVCSACGYELGIYDCVWFFDGTYGYERNHCPNCGARVIKSDQDLAQEACE